jgi:hypothetical protein
VLLPKANPGLQVLMGFCFLSFIIFIILKEAPEPRHGEEESKQLPCACSHQPGKPYLLANERRLTVI